MSDEQIKKHLESCGYRRSDPDFCRILGIVRSVVNQTNKVNKEVAAQLKLLYKKPNSLDGMAWNTLNNLAHKLDDRGGRDEM